MCDKVNLLLYSVTSNAVIDFSSGPVAHGQWLCQIFSIESI
jgi:hypothetical protein